MIINDLSKTINQKPVLKNLSFQLAPSEIVGLIGRNGSGKTTLFRLIAEHYLPDAGDIQVNGRSIFTDKHQKQAIFFIDEKENFLRAYSLQRILGFYQKAYIDFDENLFLQLIQQYQFRLSSLYRQLSKGNQRLVQIILAICSNATYLLLDEPFDGLDVIVKKEVIGLMMEHLGEHRSALIASHNLNELENLIDRALLLKDHTIFKDYHLEEMRQHARKIQMVFKTKKVPLVVKEQSKLLSFQGRVITAIFESYSEELEQAIKHFEPLLYEELPLSLEDLFEANLKPKPHRLQKEVSL
ncbi:acetoin ABC transporter ATP-binding protein [Enterococcus florum]|uniref:Acetoin ABC transporter ATP-binding protein n=1 Tax=Enterococcus florum TaxID=2480627 RepID=A0A4P5P366_9ENTE|nr:ABC transporter ATP-binding protein [Enterococcus florum]GCF92165.1 acetoin ABC transporter ATP-binding protein [Enterococcus florum]